MSRTNRNAGPGVTAPAGAPKIAMHGDAGTLKRATTPVLLHQEKYLVRRHHLAPPTAVIIAELAFAHGGRR
jgi:hypothetical protein